MLKGKPAAAVSCALVFALVLLFPFPPPVSSRASSTTTSTSGSGPMAFGVLDQSASYGISPNETAAVQQADLAMLVSTGAQCIRVDIGYGPWLSNYQPSISLVDSVVGSIRADGKCLIIADAASETYRNGGAVTWSEFKAQWVQRVSTLAARYHPDYYIVIKEPGWYVPFVSDATSNPLFYNYSDWVGLTRNLTQAVLSVSPATQVGVSVPGSGFAGNKSAFYDGYAGAVQSVPGLSFLGVDVYGQTAITATKTYLSHHPVKLPLWIAETWSAPGYTTSAQAQSDATWINTVYQFGLSIHAKMLVPFYTNLFSGYSVPTTADGLVAFYQGRTPAYSAFCKVV